LFKNSYAGNFCTGLKPTKNAAKGQQNLTTNEVKEQTQK